MYAAQQGAASDNYAGTAELSQAASVAAAVNECDLAAPEGVVDLADVQAAVNMAVGALPCTARLGGVQICNAVLVQRVINAALPGGSCDATAGLVPHSVTLNWNASPSPDVKYRIYRSTTAGGPYTAVNDTAVTATTYLDYTVVGGITYYYVARAVDGAGTESPDSNEAPAVVPAP
jgi:hypothetical protein